MSSDIITLGGRPVISHVKELERQLGQPVEISVSLRIKTPTDEREKVICTVGNLEERSCKVVRLEGLAKECRRDVTLLEGEYHNFRDLRIRDEILSLIYSRPLHITDEGISAQSHAKWLVEQKFGNLDNDRLGLPFYLFEEGREDRDLFGNPARHKLLPKKEVVNYLRSNGLKFLEHDYFVQRSGIYLINRAVGKIGEESIGIQHKDKVAEVIFELIK